MEPETLTPTSPREIGRAVFHQRWTDLTFVHWPVDPELVASLLPAGTRPDVIDGQTWVGLVPFVMRRVRIFGTPALPYLSDFAETNVRLYAVDEQGRRGVVFRSLEAARLLPVIAARLSYHLPYMWSRMTVEADGQDRTYATARRAPGPSGIGGRVRIRIGGPAAEDELTQFLTARWALFGTWYGGRTTYAPVEHETWPLHTAELLELQDDLVQAAGLPAPEGAPHVLWSPGVSVRIGRPVLLRP